MNKKAANVSRKRGIWVGVDDISPKYRLINVMMGDQLIFRGEVKEIIDLQTALSKALAYPPTPRNQDTE